MQTNSLALTFFYCVPETIDFGKGTRHSPSSNLYYYNIVVCV